MTTTPERCHVVPEPIEAPEPQPVEVRQPRGHDSVKGRGYSIGLIAMLAHGPAPYSAADFGAGFEACLEYLKRHERRAF
jgi:hypothetical protein